MIADPCTLAAVYRAGALSPVDAVDGMLARIARLDPALHAFIEVWANDARLAAEVADKALRSGHDLRPLHGIPVALKDLIEVEGRTWTAGSQVHIDRRAKGTATLVQSKREFRGT